MKTDAERITTDQAAARIGITSSRLAKMRMVGDGPVFLKIGRSVLYLVNDVDAWIAGRRMTQTPAVSRRSPLQDHRAA